MSDTMFYIENVCTSQKHRGLNFATILIEKVIHVLDADNRNITVKLEVEQDADVIKRLRLYSRLWFDIEVDNIGLNITMRYIPKAARIIIEGPDGNDLEGQELMDWRIKETQRVYDRMTSNTFNNLRRVLSSKDRIKTVEFRFNPMVIYATTRYLTEDIEYSGQYRPVLLDKSVKNKLVYKMYMDCNPMKGTIGSSPGPNKECMVFWHTHPFLTTVSVAKIPINPPSYMDFLMSIYNYVKYGMYLHFVVTLTGVYPIALTTSAMAMFLGFGNDMTRYIIDKLIEPYYIVQNNKSINAMQSISKKVFDRIDDEISSDVVGEDASCDVDTVRSISTAMGVRMFVSEKIPLELLNEVEKYMKYMSLVTLGDVLDYGIANKVSFSSQIASQVEEFAPGALREPLFYNPYHYDWKDILNLISLTGEPSKDLVIALNVVWNTK
jgi:hypothetical protein